MQLLTFLFKSKGAKAGAGLVGGSGFLALIVGLHADVTGKIERETIDRKEYVKLVLEPMRTEIKGLQKGQDETKVMVRDIHNYLLKSKRK